MSLWTPEGEHEVPPERSTPSPPTDTEATAIEDLPGFDELTPEQQQEARAMAAQLAEARQRLAETPAVEVVANHVMGMYELAAIHLSAEPPATREASVAIDAMAAVVNALPGRLGDNEGVLRDALQQIQLVYVQLTSE